MIRISNSISIPDEEVDILAIRAQGAGGQNVNKVSSAIHLRFDIKASSLPEFYKERLLAFSDNRINKEGVVIIKAQSYRTQEKNRVDALNRLIELVRNATFIPKVRRSTKPTRAAKAKRMDHKTRRGKIKALRNKSTDL